MVEDYGYTYTKTYLKGLLWYLYLIML
jgi:hypothetical protein